MNLGDRYLQFQQWKSANPKGAKVIGITCLVLGIYVAGFMSGRFG